jgi:DNA-binding NarL/FixJ family response regulator
MRVAIADDAVLFRASVSSVLTDAGMTVTASVGSAEELPRAVERDPRTPPSSTSACPTTPTEGLQAAATIAAANPDVSVLVLSQHVEAHYALRLITERPHGAGYLLKERVVDVAEFIEGVQRVADGGLGVDTEVVSELLTRARGEQPRERVTARERDVLALIAEGKTNQAIAEQFLAAEKAVDSHIRNIFLQARPALHQPRPPPGARRPDVPARSRATA